MTIAQALLRHLNRTGTYWSTVPDGFGGYTFSPPQEMKCRWEALAELFFSSFTGKEEVSRAVVFVDTDLSVGDWVAEGSHLGIPDPSGLVGAYPIRSWSKVPDLRNMTFVRKALL